MNKLTKLAGIALLAGAATMGCGGKSRTTVARGPSWETNDNYKAVAGASHLTQVMEAMAEGPVSEKFEPNTELRWREAEKTFHYAKVLEENPISPGESVVRDYGITVKYIDYEEKGPSFGDMLFFKETIRSSTAGEWPKHDGHIVEENELMFLNMGEDIFDKHSYLGTLNDYDVEIKPYSIIRRTIKSYE